MAVYAALVGLMNTIQHIMNHPRLSPSLDDKLIQPLQKKVCFLLDFIEAYNYGGGSKEAADLERQITSAVHAAEDVIESHIVDQIHAGTSEVSHRCSLDLQQIIQEMDDIMEMAKEKQGLKAEQPTHSRLVMEKSAESCVVGFDEELIQLMDELTGHRSSRYTISIVGMGGMGKTTLAKTVYENLLIKQHFDVRAWATVSQQYKVEGILSQLLSSLGRVGDSGEQLHKTLFGRRYLIILDDVWSVEVWYEVSRFFPDNGNGSRVVLTTRLSNVASDCGSSCFMKNLLNENESWELFCKTAFQQHEVFPPELEEVGKEIVKLCRGLPLSIVVIGGSLLNSPRAVEYWKNVAKDIKSIPNSKEKQESLDVLFSSYNHLPAHLKPCFLYMGVLKQCYSTIPVMRIISLWIAEGFLKPNGDRVLEEIAEDYLQDLIDRNLIVVGSHRSNGKMKSCDIHDLLRDLCLKVGEQQEFVCVNKNMIRGTERRLIFDSWMPETEAPLARSIVVESNCANQQVWKKHRLLRIYSALWVGSLEKLFECVNFRNLSFHHLTSESNRLPISLSLQWNLQTLVNPDMWVAAPVEIWKMRQLRHVDSFGIHVPDPCLSDGQDECILENLQTLKKALNLRLSEGVCKNIPNIKKLHLLYDRVFYDYGYDDSLIESLCNLSRLHKLKSLKLIMPTEHSRANKMLTFPNSLKELSLSYCKLHWDDLTMIGSLPKLEVLKLEMYSVSDGERWSPVDGQFRRLKFLKIEFCDLVCWNAESLHFPVLEKLVLNEMWMLEEIPLGIGEIPTLQLIRVDKCSVSAAISAVKIKEDQIDTYGNYDLQIQVRMHYWDLPSFMEMVDEEGITIHNIEFQKF